MLMIVIDQMRFFTFVLLDTVKIRLLSRSWEQVRNLSQELFYGHYFNNIEMLIFFTFLLS